MSRQSRASAAPEAVTVQPAIVAVSPFYRSADPSRSAIQGYSRDLGVIGDQTLGRRAINLLRPEARGRMNGLFTGLFFLGAAAGSGVSGVVWVNSGWPGLCAVGAAFGCAALALSLTERRDG